MDQNKWQSKIGSEEGRIETPFPVKRYKGVAMRIEGAELNAIQEVEELGSYC